MMTVIHDGILTCLIVAFAAIIIAFAICLICGGGPK